MPSFDEALPLIMASAPPPPPGGSASGPFEGLGPFAAAVAALLDRQVGASAWRPAIEAMDEAGLLDPSRMERAGMPEIQDALRGKVRALSARTLAPAKALARWLVEHHDGRAETLRDPSRSTDVLREELADVRGIGPAGADAILLAASGRPTYSVDRGTYRILVRHGWLDASSSYEDARDDLVHRGGGDPDRLRALAAGMSELAARFCRASAPRCDACPLRPMLPEGGPMGAQGD